MGKYAALWGVLCLVGCGGTVTESGGNGCGGVATGAGGMTGSGGGSESAATVSGNGGSGYGGGGVCDPPDGCQPFACEPGFVPVKCAAPAPPTCISVVIPCLAPVGVSAYCCPAP